MRPVPGHTPDTRLIISLGLHSAAIIAFQLSLMQLIAVVQWHHFAYMIISVAMLGFGASGTLLALMRERLLRMAPWLVPSLMTLSGLLMMTAFPLSRLGVFQFDIYLLFTDASQWPMLAATYLIFFLPFFAGATAIGILFIRHAGQIGRYYFSNLLGSGLGGLLVLGLMGTLHPTWVPLAVGMLSVAAGLTAMGGENPKTQWILALLAIPLLLFLGPRKDIPVSEYKSLALAMNLPEARVIHSEPSVHGLIEVVESPVLRFAPAVSLNHTQAFPVKPHVFLNAEMFGVIPRFRPDQESHVLDFTTMALPYIMGTPREKLLLLRAGAGAPVALAMVRQAGHVDAVIENRAIVRMMKSHFTEQSGGLFQQDGLHIHSVDPRSFLSTAPSGAYDLISLPLQESFGGTAGLHALREDYSMTLEAFGRMWDLLADDGVITVSSWVDYPVRTPLKILSTLVETARQKGVAEPSDHIAAIRSWGTISFVLKKSPLTTAEIQSIRAFCLDMSFDPALLPGISEAERARFNLLDDPSLLTHMDRILLDDKNALRDYGFQIAPSTDDRPYFSQFLQLNRMGWLYRVYGPEQMPYLELGYLIVLVTLAQSGLLALLLIILPLLRLRKSQRGKKGSILYFGALGLGYMFAEIILIQRFVLYFGFPVYAIAAVISTMLIASGIGSLLSERLPPVPASARKMALAVGIILLAYALVLTPIIQHSISAPMGLKVFIGLLLIGLPAFFMGMLFPLGIRFLTGYDESQVPWAWGINGCISVISTSLATLIAVEAGFQVVMLVAVACYLLAFGCFAGHRWFFPVRR